LIRASRLGGANLRRGDLVNKILLVTVLLAASIVLAGCGSSDSESASSTDTTTTEQTTESTETTTTAETTAPPPGPTVVRITVVDGAPQGGVVRESVDKDERVVLVVTSDVADEIHLHGYDVSRDVAAGGTVRLPFTATLPGRFEVELEERGVQIADLTVNP
jgi:ABC-type glycerol-3-phosphate transport system substrate-binding protein